ncbi:MAG: PAS domain S-box protein, partial [Desulfovibrionaceae bacterium]
MSPRLLRLPPTGPSSRFTLYLALCIAAVITVYLALFAGFVSDQTQRSEEHLREHLRQMVQMARSAVSGLAADCAADRISPEEAQRLAEGVVSRLRFGPHDENYVFMATMEGEPLVTPHEVLPAPGSLRDFRDPNGVYVYRELTRLAQEHPEGGFLAYAFMRPGTGALQGKLSFVLPVPELGIYLGAGLYLDGLRQEADTFTRWSMALASVAFLLVAGPLVAALMVLRRGNRRLRGEMEKRWRIEEVMRESESRYRALFENAPVGIAQTSAQGRLLRVNPEMARMFGYPSVRAMLEQARNVAEALWEDPAQRVAFLAELDERGDLLGREVRLKTSDGEVRWCMLHSRQVLADDGEVLYTESFISDITDRRAAEEELRLSEERFRLVAVQKDQLVYDWDLQDGRMRWHGNVRTITGLAREQWEEGGVEFWRSRLHPDDAETVRSMLDAVLAEGSKLITEYRLRRGDGSYVFMEDRGLVLRDAQGRAYRMLGTLRDISERKRAEEDLRRSEAVFRALLNATRDTALLVEPDSRIVTANAVVANTLGISAEQLVGMRFHDWMEPETAESRLGAVRETVRTRSPLWFVDQRAGRVFENSFYPVLDGQGRVERVAIFARDVTEQREAEAALRESEARLRSIFENAPVGIFQARPGGRFLSVNPEFARIAGFDTSEELLQQVPNIGEFFESPGLMDELRRLLDEQGEIVDYEVPAQRRDGSPVWVSANAVVLYDAADQASRFEGFIMDITARRLAQEALAESEGRYRALFERASSGILLLRAHRIVECNPKAEALFGGSREALIGRSPWEFSPEFQPEGTSSSEAESRYKAALDQGDALHFEWLHRHSGGDVFWADITLSPIIIRGELHTLAEVNDITERKRAEEQSRMFARIASASNDHMAFVTRSWSIW